MIQRRRDLGGTARKPCAIMPVAQSGLAATGRGNDRRSFLGSWVRARGWSGRVASRMIQRGSTPLAANAHAPAPKPASCAGVNPRPSSRSVSGRSCQVYETIGPRQLRLEARRGHR